MEDSLSLNGVTPRPVVHLESALSQSGLAITTESPTEASQRQGETNLPWSDSRWELHDLEKSRVVPRQDLSHEIIELGENSYNVSALSSSVMNQFTDPTNAEQLHPCPDCPSYQGKTGFKRKDHLIQHLRGLHNWDDNQLAILFPPRQTRRLQIPVCHFPECDYYRDPSFKDMDIREQEENRPFGRQSDYTNHMKREHNWSPYPCKVTGCSKVNGTGFFRTTTLKRHCEVKHPGITIPAPTVQDLTRKADSVKNTIATESHNGHVTLSSKPPRKRKETFARKQQSGFHDNLCAVDPTLSETAFIYPEVAQEKETTVSHGAYYRDNIALDYVGDSLLNLVPISGDPSGDSGYVSLLDPQQISSNIHSTGNLHEDSSTPLLPLSPDDLTEVGTLVSTFAIPEVARHSIIHICEDIYNTVRPETDLSQYGHLIKTVPELIKAFAIRLGSCSSDRISWRIMHFVYKHHNQISSILKVKLGGEDNHESKLNMSDEPDMSLVDKMSLWGKTDGKPQTGENNMTDYFEGVDDLENDEPLSTPELSSYIKDILGHSAYKWLLNTMKSQLALNWGNLLQSLKAELGTEKGSQRASSLANIRVLIASGGTDLQLSTIGQYIYRVWPELGTNLLDGFQWLLDEIDEDSGSKFSASFGDEGGIELFYDNSDLCANIHGLAYTIARYAEQLAWLEAALRIRSRCISPSFYTPSLVEDNQRVFFVEASAAPPTSSLAIPWFIAREIACSCLSFSSLVSEYPTSHRPEGFSGVEMPFGFPDPSANMLLQADNGHLTLHVGSLVFSFVKRKAGVWLWHGVNSTHNKCGCRNSSALGVMVDILDREIVDIASHQRHIIGDCGTGVEQNEASGHEGHLDRLTMPHTNNDRLVDDDKYLTGRYSSSNSADSDLVSFSSFSEVGARGTIPLGSGLTDIVNNAAARLLAECNIRATPQQPAELNDAGFQSGSQENSGRLSYVDQTENNQLAPRSMQKRKLNQRDDDDEDDGIPERQHTKKRRDEPDSKKKSFACPYWKFDPIKHRACFYRKLSIISRVKQHLARNHAPRFYCQRCYLLFTDVATQELHVMQRSCNREPGARLDGIHPYQQAELSRKPKLRLSEEQQWFRIWNIVFPEKQRPVSPYIDSRLGDCCARFREHCQNRGPEILSADIRDSGLLPIGAADEDEREQLLREVLARGLDMIFDSWNAQMTASQNESMPPPTTSELSISISSQRHNTPAFADCTTPMSSFVDSALGSWENSTGSFSTANTYAGTALFPFNTETSVDQHHNSNIEAPPAHTVQSFQEILPWNPEFSDFLGGLNDSASCNAPTTADPSHIDSLMPESSEDLA
ncbi:hypothetical protein F4801DRAFT_585799 [Xylaria longipes]|nr:hypothetical protein F4801DRAFT_585799 [Xylaria longipes]